MEKSKTAVTPGVKAKEEDEDDEELGKAESREFRSLAHELILWHLTAQTFNIA